MQLRSVGLVRDGPEGRSHSSWAWTSCAALHETLLPFSQLLSEKPTREEVWGVTPPDTDWSDVVTMSQALCKH